MSALLGSGEEGNVDSPGGTIPAQLLRCLPQPLAVLLCEYDAEHHPCQKLHRICECAEMLVRFVVAVALAELRRSAPASFDSAELQTALLGDETKGMQGLSRPTFGDWLEILHSAMEQMPSPTALVVPEIRTIVPRLIELIRPSNHTPENAIYDLRNALAHDGRFSRERAIDCLYKHGHRRRFEDFWQDDNSRFLNDSCLWGVVSEDQAVLLRGSSERLEKGRSTHLTQLLSSQNQGQIARVGSLLLTRERCPDHLQLSPLFVVGKIYTREGIPLVDEMAIQVYCRDLVEYTVLHSIIGHGYATNELKEQFGEMFPLRRWREQRREG